MRAVYQHSSSSQMNMSVIRVARARDALEMGAPRCSLVGHTRAAGGRVPHRRAAEGGNSIYANKNSFVRSSLMVSRSLAACSNSKRLAASRISFSSLAM